jgi:Uma2 family endonuclease
MAVALLKEPPLAPQTGLGPYRCADYDALPDEPRCELILGRFYLSPAPSPLHQMVTFLLGQHLFAIAKATGGVLFLAPLDVVLADHSVVQPDILYLSAARRGLVQGRRIEGSPDLIVEVLSPGNLRRDQDEKLALYAQSGVREYWIANPVEREFLFLVNREGQFVVVRPTGAEYRSAVVPEVRLDVEAFWREVDEQTLTFGP